MILWILTGTVFCIALAIGFYQHGVCKGWDEARALYKPMLDDAWNRGDSYFKALLVLNPPTPAQKRGKR